MDIIHETDIRKTLAKKDEAFAFLEQTPVHRSFVNLQKLMPRAANILRKVLIEGNVPRDLNDEGVRTCYEQGWLHTEALDSKAIKIICILPTNLHAKSVPSPFLSACPSLRHKAGL
jgi:hypothetical protein